ncbi:hypothetical protein MKW94_005837 [Papaver nudicaule]|uniref:CDP-diacylglycerol--glycerol-3-phosphate 3-phosphatidyltransferase n=1 Tax=Papaver nudicaule TaxID=74823 RepID=A0AA41VQJ3_PAPNU|nr:hypothetical protein [Papaver nudicaule]
MATLKVTVLSSSSSSICGKSYLLADKWVRRIKNTSFKSISSSSSISRNKSLVVRVFMDTERTTSKGSMSIIGQKQDGISFGFTDGGVVNRGLGNYWRSYGKKPLNSETNGVVSEMVAKEDEKEEEERNQIVEEKQTEKLLTLPTILTIGRVAAVPLLISTFYMTSSWATTVTTSIFIVAAITDWLDGYLARKMRLGTAFGAFLDPVADKLMVAATLVLLCTRPLEVAAFGQVPWLLPVPAIAIIGREITMSAVREWAASQNAKVLEAVAVNNLGKWKTATQMTALTILLASRDSSLSGSGALVGSGVALLYISAGLAVWSLAVYMKNIWRIMVKL